MRLDAQVKNTVDGESLEHKFSALWIFVCPYKEVLYFETLTIPVLIYIFLCEAVNKLSSISYLRKYSPLFYLMTWTFLLNNYS